MLDVPEALLAERARLGVDRWDEVWEGVLHMALMRSGSHQRLGAELLLALDGPCDQRGVELLYSIGLFAAEDDFRIPDLTAFRPEHLAERGVDDTAELVVEILSPGDESRDKLPWYAARRVAEMVIIDPDSRTVELWSGRSGEPELIADTAAGTPVELTTVGAVLTTIATADGPRLRVEVDGTATDI
jgi:Uma2 family endonuclease